jgi:hypothetical protein
MTKSKTQERPGMEKSHKPPENKDNLDSRKKIENYPKGDDTTHNKKEIHGEPKKKK